LIPIITDDYPDPTFGSGAVKITGAHDFNDYGVAKRNNIPCYRLMDTRAAMRADGVPYDQAAAIAQSVARGERTLTEAETDALNLVPDDLRGLDRYEARKRVVDQINAEGLAVTLLKKSIDKETGAEHLERIPYVEAKPIMQPFGDRSKVVIEPMLTDQWFVDTARIVEPALEAVRTGRTKIIPESGEKTYYHWLENIEPWCISRQLWWGHQIPVWFDDEGNQYCAENEAAARAMAPGKILTRDPDVLDTWFSSGLWPIGTLGWPEPTPELAKYFPTSVLVTGADILFFWVARMMMMQLAVVNDIPFHTVYLHGLVRDAKGKKMSKSLGNVIDPLEIIDEYGADALRFANAAMASLGGVLKLDTSRIAGYRNFGTKLWNATRFAEMNGATYPERTYVKKTSGRRKEDVHHTVNKWIIGETARTRLTVDDALSNFRFNDAAQALYAFVWGKVCDWYVEFTKPLMDGDHAAETRDTMAWVLDQCYLMLHPFMPFITEDLWAQTATRDSMLVHGNWPTYGAELIDESADAEMNWVISLIEEIRSARAQMHVPAGLKLPIVQTALDARGRHAWAHNAPMIERLARLDGLTEGEAPKGSISIAVEGGSFAIPLAGVIDVAEEKSRLSKTLDKLGKEIGGLKGRLNNPNFVASAPEEVVDEARENLALREDEAGKIEAALKRLAEVG
ncbi:MAG: hypothetical protein RLZZ528_1498, partial [Pseudomonadota bacterium]